MIVTVGDVALILVEQFRGPRLDLEANVYRPVNLQSSSCARSSMSCSFFVLLSLYLCKKMCTFESFALFGDDLNILRVVPPPPPHEGIPMLFVLYPWKSVNGYKFQVKLTRLAFFLPVYSF